MKNSPINFALILLIAGTIMTSCQSSATKVEKAEDKVQEANSDVVEANDELKQARLDSIQQFRKESADRITANEKSIADYKVKFAKEKKETKVLYEKKLAQLEQKNIEMKKKLDDYNDEGRSDWNTFKTEFNHDLDELGKAFRDMSIKNVK